MCFIIFVKFLLSSIFPFFIGPNKIFYPPKAPEQIYVNILKQKMPLNQTASRRPPLSPLPQSLIHQLTQKLHIRDVP